MEGLQTNIKIMLPVWYEMFRKSAFCGFQKLICKKINVQILNHVAMSEQQFKLDAGAHYQGIRVLYPKM
jgi:hypothetical protein